LDVPAETLLWRSPADAVTEPQTAARSS